MLDHGGDVNITFRGKGGQAPLHVAAILGNIKIAEILISHGASLELKTISGERPIDFAQKHGVDDLVALLRAKMDAQA
jgi:ankyrin repeat protein